MIELPSLEAFKRCEDVALSDMVYWWTWQRWVIILEVFCNLNNPMILSASCPAQPSPGLKAVFVVVS